MTELSDEAMDEVAADPWAPILRALTHEAKGETVPEDLGERAWSAAGLLAAASLVNAGMEIDTVERLFVERAWGARFTYDKADDSIGVSIEWEDGERLEVRQGADD